MPAFIIYLLKVSAWLVPFYLLYLALFRRFTFFNLNRYYLLATLLLSFVLPLVHYSIIDRQIVEVAAPKKMMLPAVDAGTIFTEDEIINPVTAAVPASGFVTWHNLLLAIYIAGFAWFFLRLCAGLWRVRCLIRGSRVVKQGRLRLALTHSATAPASFFNYILIPESLLGHAEFPAIMAHETAHVSKKHSADLLVCGIAKAVLWFNPFIWLHRRSLQEVHEFEADQAAAKQLNVKQYAGLLLQLAAIGQPALLNAFSIKPVKTRIQMLFTPKTNFMKRFAYLSILPVTILLLMAFRNIIRKTEKVYQFKNDFVLMIDAGHGGKDPGAKGLNGLVEKDITLSLALQLKAQAEAAGIKVVMTRSEDKSMTLQERTQLAATENASLIMNLHVSATGNERDLKNGIEFYAGQNNNPAFATASLKAVTHLSKALQTVDGIKVNPNPLSRSLSIWMLKQAPCPSVLIECGYVNNVNDAAFLANEEKKTALAKALLTGVMEYSKTTETAAAASIQAADETPVLPLEAKITQLHTLQKTAYLLMDGKVPAYEALTSINPAKIKSYRYFMAGNEMAQSKYGAKAKTGALILETVGGKGDGAFADETEKQKWMVYANNHRRISQVEKYEHFTFTETPAGVPVDVYVIAEGPRPAVSSELPHQRIISCPANIASPMMRFWVDETEVSEAVFAKTINELNYTQYQVFSPGDAKGKSYYPAIGIRRTASVGSTKAFQHFFWNKIVTKEGC
jgi:N-acetylmuramoyl-L-alanine amidase